MEQVAKALEPTLRAVVDEVISSNMKRFKQDVAEQVKAHVENLKHEVSEVARESAKPGVSVGEL